MEVILAEYLGFCYGVKRAIKIAREHADGKSCTLGPIIHNPQMVERLKNEGVGTIENLSEMTEGTVIIRSHGVGPEVYEKIKAKGLEVVDATCPRVKRAQMAARELVQDGYTVVIVGEKNHPEVKSIFEWALGDRRRSKKICSLSETRNSFTDNSFGSALQKHGYALIRKVVGHKNFTNDMHGDRSKADCGDGVGFKS